MADHGKLYRGFDNTYANAMKQLCMRADVMIPNITEAAMMTGMPYQEEYSHDYIQELLTKLGGNDVVLTGVSFERDKTGAAIRTMQERCFYFHDRYDRSFHGTGDIFASAFTGALMQDRSVVEAVKISADFTCKAIYNTIQNPAHWYGVKFETALGALIDDLK
jgi:pyridoxine kinase